MSAPTEGVPSNALNFVACQWCGGNAGAPSHQCSQEGQRLQQEAATRAVSEMFAGLFKPVEQMTKAELRRKLMECEAALESTEAALAECERLVAEAVAAERERCAAIVREEWAKATLNLDGPYRQVAIARLGPLETILAAIEADR